jgi:GTPase KRas protein
LIADDNTTKRFEVDGEPIACDILDTAVRLSSDEFLASGTHWYKKFKGFLLVYSVTSRSSFDEIAEWRNRILKAHEVKKFPIVLVGNKIDLESQRVVSTAEGKAFADQFGMPFLETSAKDQINNLLCFYELAREIRKSQSPDYQDQTPQKRPSECNVQ